MKRLPHSRFALPIVGALLLATLVTGSYFLGRAISGGESTSAQAPHGTPTPVPAGEELPALPDTSQPGWARPYVDREQRLPRYEQTISGITVGPDVDATLCPEGIPAERVTYDATVASAVAIAPTYLPDNAKETLESAIFTACDGTPYLATREYLVLSDEADMRRVAAGEITFFEARHAAAFGIHRRILREPAFPSALSSERARPTEISGLPAVVFDPMFAEGFGDASILLWDKDTMVMTVIQTTAMTISEAIRIAEGVLNQ